MSTTIEKTRPDDLLGNLPEDQQNIILDWCEESSYRDVLKKIAAPPPEGLGLELRKDSFLTSLDSEGLVKRGDVYQSLDWSEAGRRVTVDLDAAFGSVKVVWVR